MATVIVVVARRTSITTATESEKSICEASIAVGTTVIMVNKLNKVLTIKRWQRDGTDDQLETESQCSADTAFAVLFWDESWLPLKSEVVGDVEREEMGIDGGVNDLYDIDSDKSEVAKVAITAVVVLFVFEGILEPVASDAFCFFDCDMSTFANLGIAFVVRVANDEIAVSITVFVVILIIEMYGVAKSGYSSVEYR